jgi:hypothetical protein
MPGSAFAEKVFDVIEAAGAGACRCPSIRRGARSSPHRGVQAGGPEPHHHHRHRINQGSTPDLSPPSADSDFYMRVQPSSAADHLESRMPAAVRTHHQLGFGSGGYTGTVANAGRRRRVRTRRSVTTKPFRFGISTYGRLVASITPFSLMMPFR